MGTHSSAETAGAPPVPLSRSEVEVTYQRLRELADGPLTEAQRLLLRFSQPQPRTKKPTDLPGRRPSAPLRAG